jgi:hypothetical protein
LDDKIKQLLKELGSAINDSISNSEDVNEHIQRIRDQGYNLTSFDATISLNKLGEEEGARRSPAKALVKSDRRCGSASRTIWPSSAPSASIRPERSDAPAAWRSSRLPVTNDGANLYDLAQPRLERALSTIVSPPFRIKQIEEWMYVHGVDAFDAMTNLPKELRTALAEHYTLAFPQVLERTTPAADGSQKYLFSLADGNRIEAVYMPMGDRTSVCLSSQAGCAVGCTFCVTGFFGAGRNLTPGEMLGQFFTIQHEHNVPME